MRFKGLLVFPPGSEIVFAFDSLNILVNIDFHSFAPGDFPCTTNNSTVCFNSLLSPASKATSRLCITGPLLGESTGDRCISPPKSL